jgi:pimeloyl-ACP methyl ester carboxylesterase
MRHEHSAAFAALAALVAVGCQDGQDQDLATALAEPDAPARAQEAAATTKVDRSGLTDVGTTGPLDYGDRRMWLCRPGNDPDECNANLDTTELLADGSRKVVPHARAEDPAFDCFYVYPTVKLSGVGPMTDFANISITLDPLLSQGARFNKLCRAYAPLYRQMGVVPNADGSPGASVRTNLGLDDVRQAFAHYLKHFNQGRKFVLIGHSQGTGMLTAMTAQDIDPKPEVRAQMLSALLIGGSVAVPAGQTVGGTFKNIPLCTKAGETGCVISYVSYSKEVPPSATSTFGRAPAPGQVAGCTEPAALAGRAGQPYLGSYIRLQRVNPGFAADGMDKLPKDIATPFLLYRNVFRGTCKTNEAGFSWLEVSLDWPANDSRPLPPYHNARTEAALGLHVLDYNLELDDLIEAVRLQAVSVK